MERYWREQISYYQGHLFLCVGRRSCQAGFYAFESPLRFFSPSRVGKEYKHPAELLCCVWGVRRGSALELGSAELKKKPALSTLCSAVLTCGEYSVLRDRKKSWLPICLGHLHSALASLLEECGSCLARSLEGGKSRHSCRGRTTFMSVMSFILAASVSAWKKTLL